MLCRPIGPVNLPPCPWCVLRESTWSADTLRALAILDTNASTSCMPVWRGWRLAPVWAAHQRIKTAFKALQMPMGNPQARESAKGFVVPAKREPP